MRTPSTDWFRWHENALLLNVAVQPGAKISEFVGLHGGTLKTRIQAPPIDGKANRALMEFLADEFATPRGRVSVVRGVTSRTKLLRIDQPVTLPTALQELGLQSPHVVRK